MTQEHVETARYVIASAPAEISIIGLGSCVAVTLWAPGLGAMSHSMLPRLAEGRDRKNVLKYVDATIAIMVDELEDRGLARDMMEAKIIGGSNMFARLATNSLDIGRRNVEAAVEMLAREGIEVVASDTGGSEGRTVILNVADGSVRVRTQTRNISL